MTHSRLTAVRPAGKRCAFVQTALRPSAVLHHVGNLASFARGVAKQEQGEFLKRRGFGSGKVLRWTLSCTMYRCTVYHVGSLASCARGVAKHKPKRIFEPMQFWERKGFGKLSRLAGFAQFF